MLPPGQSKPFHSVGSSRHDSPKPAASLLTDSSILPSERRCWSKQPSQRALGRGHIPNKVCPIQNNPPSRTSRPAAASGAMGTNYALLHGHRSCRHKQDGITPLYDSISLDQTDLETRQEQGSMRRPSGNDCPRDKLRIQIYGVWQHRSC